MRRRTSLIPFLSFLFSACVGLLALSSQVAAQPDQATRPAAVEAGFGEFVAFCPLSHRGPNDPIVHPNMPGMSHLHDFLGNTSTGPSSTLESLMVGGTTCDPVTDKSAYWVPTLRDGKGDPIPFEQVTVYYFIDTEPASALKPYPPGLKIIAGDAGATAPPNPSFFKWGCLGSGVSSTTGFVVCPAGSKLELLLNFPDCWDGVNLDSANHKSHMTYSQGAKCPGSHPVPVPRLQFKLRYASPGETGMNLSSGPAYTLHGDFFNAWEVAALASRMNCLKQLIKCGPEGFPGQPDPAVTAVPTGAPTPTATGAATASPTPSATTAPSIHPPRSRLPIVIKP